MPERNSQLEIRSNEMEEIVGTVPPWIVRWGIVVLFCVGILGLFIANKVSYPDTIRGEVLVQALEQPGKVTVRREDASQEFRFLVKEGDQVKPGDTLLVRYDSNTKEHFPTITPMAGTIYISKGIDEKNTLDQLIWVVPESSRAEIKIRYGTVGAGKVKEGQQVRIALYDYPSNEYGFLNGRISSILPVRVEDAHQANVQLEQGKIVTSDGKELPVLPVMQGEGEILLNERSIFQRIFGSILPH